MSTDYFNMLDNDGDKKISYSEFLAPILESIPPRVSQAFVSDVRFKIEVFTNIRAAFKTCQQISDVVTLDLVAGKLAERNDPFAEHFIAKLSELTFDT
jgi:hypothetical protein